MNLSKPISLRPNNPLLNEKLTRPDWINVPARNTDFLWLDKNENLDTVFIDLIRKEVIAKQIEGTDISTYPELGQLYKDLATLEQVDPTELLLTTGSDGAIKTVFQTFVEPGSKVFITNPSFAMYDVYCKIYGADTTYIEYKRENNRIFLDVEWLIQQILEKKPRLVCLPNPDSPTGTVLPESQMLEIYEACLEADTVLFVDEAYYPFCDFTMAKHIANSGKGNLIVCRTFSKAWGLAGVRVGHLISSPNIISIMNKTRPMYEIGSLAMKIAHAALPYHGAMKESVEVIKQGKYFFENAMQALGFNTLDTKGNFSHVSFGAQRERIFDELDRFVYYRKDFSHPSLQGFTRFSAAPVSVMEKVVNSISNVIK